jgi:hypothetical protein
VTSGDHHSTAAAALLGEKFDHRRGGGYRARSRRRRRTRVTIGLRPRRALLATAARGWALRANPKPETPGARPTPRAPRRGEGARGAGGMLSKVQTRTAKPLQFSTFPLIPHPARDAQRKSRAVRFVPTPRFPPLSGSGARGGALCYLSSQPGRYPPNHWAMRIPRASPALHRSRGNKGRGRRPRAPSDPPAIMASGGSWNPQLTQLV